MSQKTVDEAMKGYHDNGYTHLTAAATLALYQQNVRCTANTATDSYTVTLPPVAAAKGLIFNIFADIANSKAVTLQDNNNDAGFADKTLDTDNDHISIRSNGKEWEVVETAIA